MTEYLMKTPHQGRQNDDLIEIYRTNAAFTKGDVGQVDQTEVSSDLGVPSQTNYATPSGSVAKILRRDMDVGAEDTGNLFHEYGIALEDIASGAEGRFLMKGYVSANVDSGISAGDALFAIASKQLGASTTGGSKCIGRALQATQTPDLTVIEFDGINGFGTYNTIS